MAEKIKNGPHRRTVSVELFNAWQRLKRKGDPEEMATRFGYSRVPFDNALKWGFVAKNEISKNINTFFKERLDSEKKSAEELSGLADEIEALNRSENDTSTDN